SEYVISMARLYRLAGKRGVVLEHMRGGLGRELSRRFGVDPAMGTDRLIEELKRRGDIDVERLRGLLKALNPSHPPSERELLRLMREMDELLRRDRV
ncbi:hypothetical protein DRP77_10250, partial [Candidatus Poribacteria bacterium]